MSSKPQSVPYAIQLSLPFVVAFISLRHFLHELHEFMHMIVGRVLCGAWGTRDFNCVHPMSASCAERYAKESLVGLEGPLVNYVLMYAGAVIIARSKSVNNKAWGIDLIFANLPMARLLTALFGGGDEQGVVRSFIDNPVSARILGTALIALTLAYPLFMAYKTIPAKNRIIWFAGFLFLPMILEGIVVLVFFNFLLEQNVLSSTMVFGAPALVIVVLCVSVIAILFTAKYIGALFRSYNA